MHWKNSPKSLSESFRHRLITTTLPAKKTVSTLENPKLPTVFSKVLTVSPKVLRGNDHEKSRHGAQYHSNG